MSKQIKAWHFLAEDKRLGYDDGRKVRLGRLLKVKCEPVLCKQGLHASIRVIDALDYAQGPIACRVIVGGRVVKGEDKIVGTERTVIGWCDATNVLHRFACLVASNALKGQNITDDRCWNAINTKLKWLRGEATDAELAVARDAARDAAWAAAWDAARAAAWDAAWDAAMGRDAAGAAWAAAWDAARDAARGAARDAARDAQSRMLGNMLTEEIKKQKK